MTSELRSSNYADEIIPGIWLGSSDSFYSELPLLREFGVTAVLRALPIPNQHDRTRIDELWASAALPPRSPQNHLAIEIEDDEDVDIFTHLAPATKWISDKKGGVLVFCRAGASRSASFVTAFIMKKLSLGAEAALDMVRARRNVVNPNIGFLWGLAEYHRSIFEGSSPLDITTISRWSFRFPRLSYKQLREIQVEALALRKEEVRAGSTTDQQSPQQAGNGSMFQKNLDPAVVERMRIDALFERLATAAMKPLIEASRKEFEKRHGGEAKEQFE